MSYKAEIILDSINPDNDRLTTMAITYPRFIHSEMLRHRIFSRSVASSRAIPVKKMIQMVEDDPVIPTFWGKNQSGMQAYEEISKEDQVSALKVWMDLMEDTVASVKQLVGLDSVYTFDQLNNEFIPKKLDVHKQIANRLLEPFSWVTETISGTEWENFFNLRCKPAAQPEIQVIANLMKEAYNNNTPEFLEWGQWHLPYITKEDEKEILEKYTDSNENSGLRHHSNKALEVAKQVSSARCARTSYLNHLGTRELNKDIELFEKLISGPHYSPLEHVAQANSIYYQWANFRGWKQYRKEFIGESGVFNE